MNYSYLKVSHFRLFIFQRILLILGNVAIALSLSVYTLTVTNSILEFALMLILSAVPHVVIGPFLNCYFERVNRKAVLVFFDLVRTVYLIVLAFLITREELSLLDTKIAILFFSFCSAILRTSTSTVLSKVLKKEHRAGGTGLVNRIETATNIFAPVITAIIYEKLGLMIVFFVGAGTFLSLAGIDFFLKFKKSVPKQNVKIIHSVATNFNVLKTSKIHLLLFSNVALSQFLIKPFLSIGVTFILFKLFLLPESTYGIAKAVAGVGSVISLFMIGYLSKKNEILWNITLSAYASILSVGLYLLLWLKDLQTLFAHLTFAAVTFFVLTRLLVAIPTGINGILYVNYCEESLPTELLKKFHSHRRTLLKLVRIAGLYIYGQLFAKDYLLYPFGLLAVALVLKAVIHFPVLKQVVRKAPGELMTRTT